MFRVRLRIAAAFHQAPQPIRIVLQKSPFPRKNSNFSTSTSSRVYPLNGLSESYGPKDVPLVEITLGQYFSNLVSTHGDKKALVVRHEASDYHSLDYAGGEIQNCLRWNFKELSIHVEGLRRGLKGMGLVKGDRLAVFSGNNSIYAALQWATAKSGIILTCINPAAREPELVAALNLSSSKALFITPTYKTTNHFDFLSKLQASCPSLERIILIDNTKLGAERFGSLLEENGFARNDDYRAILDFKSNETIAVEQDVHDVINLQFTSGTTGLPKAVSLTHHNLLNNGILVSECMELSEGEETLILTVPNFHCFGLVLGNLAFWTKACCLVYPSETFEAAAALRAAMIEQATAIHGVPTMFLAILAVLDSDLDLNVPENLRNLDRLRTGIAAGSAVPSSLMDSLVKRMGLKDLVITFGMTETSPASVNSRPSDSLQKRCETVGRVLPHTKIRIVSPLHSLYPSPATPATSVGESGEIWTSGYCLSPGYWQNDEETKKTQFTSNGERWIRTGDIGIMDEGGYISIVGRAKEQIARGGEKLSPFQIENRALQMEGILDASVIGVPDAFMGEVVGMYVKRALNEQGNKLTRKDISDHINLVLSSQARPDWIWFVGEDIEEIDWPKTASGKIRKVELREWAVPLMEKGIGKMRA